MKKIKCGSAYLGSGLIAIIYLSASAAFADSVDCAYTPHLSCRDAQTSVVLWENPSYSDPDKFAVGDTHLYISKNTTSTSIDVSTGTPQWQVETGSDASYFYPTLSGNAIYLARTDGIVEKRSANSGTLIWSRRLADGWVYPPIVQQNKVITGGQDRIIWVLDASSGEIRNQITLDQELVAPLFEVAGLVIASTFDSRLNAFQIDSHSSNVQTLWTTQLGAPAFSYLNESQNLITADMGGNLSSIDPATGAIRWQQSVHQNALFWNTFDHQTLFSLTESGSLKILDADTGILQKNLQLEHQYIQAPIIQGDSVALYDTNGVLQRIALHTLITRPSPHS
jgi:outer membrane protein assembly factor BamB